VQLRALLLRSGIVSRAQSAEAERVELEALMARLDANGDGQIDVNEFLAATAELQVRYGLPPLPAAMMLPLSPLTCSTYYVYLLLLGTVVQILTRANDLYWAFARLDADGDGYIDAGEARRVLGSRPDIGARAAAYIAEFDANGDGKLDYQARCSLRRGQATLHPMTCDHCRSSLTCCCLKATEGLKSTVLLCSIPLWAAMFIKARLSGSTIVDFKMQSLLAMSSLFVWYISKFKVISSLARRAADVSFATAH
jgi:Ca2+-binding EF-hand superfamily protein